MSDSADGPPLFRPVPRRPFVFDLRSSTPQSITPPKDDDSDGEEQQLADEILLDRFRRDLMKAGFVGSRPSNDSPPDSPSLLAQSHSTADLNSSTLAGIYDCSDQEDVFNGADDDEELHNPWGTGAESPVKRRDSLSRGTYELMRDRSRRQSYASTDASRLRQQPPSPASRAAWLASRALVLFVLGAGYGVLVTHLHQEQGLLQLPDAGSGMPRYNGSYTAMWGFALAAVAMGALQPWVDGAWDGLFGRRGQPPEADSAESLPDGAEKLETDWALVMRAVGVFVGVAFAVRRLAWTSSTQVSIAMALANVFLWWLIDRTMAALVLSTVVGAVGTLFLLSVSPDVIRAPSTTFITQTHNASSAEPPAELATLLGGIASPETVEAGIWILGVLFCTCLCFGNIGRRLVKSKSGGRWDRQDLYSR
ncbi:insulin-induced protein domain-containing protein [Trichoderma novae-zelandiae]